MNFLLYIFFFALQPILSILNVFKLPEYFNYANALAGIWKFESRKTREHTERALPTVGPVEISHTHLVLCAADVVIWTTADTRNQSRLVSVRVRSHGKRFPMSFEPPVWNAMTLSRQRRRCALKAYRSSDRVNVCTTAIVASVCFL